MIKMAKLTEYALMVIGELKSTRLPMSADALASQVGLETTTVSKILKQLKKSGMLTSKRGVAGGYSLIGEHASLSLHDVICAMEGDVALTECVDSGCGCRMMSGCHISSGLKRVNDVISDVLKKVTVDEIVDKRDVLPVQIKS